jgi:hypothetical protein
LKEELRLKNIFFEIITNILNPILDIIHYIFNLHITDIPYLIFTIGISGVIGYIVSMIIVGVPCAIWEAVTKKKTQDEKQEKVIKIIAICLSVIFLLGVLYERSQN